MAQMHCCGRMPTYNYIIMSLLGPSIADLRRLIPEQRFTLPTAIRLAVECLAAVANVHKIGFVHRDVKPSNFAIGLLFFFDNIWHMMS